MIINATSAKLWLLICNTNIFVFEGNEKLKHLGIKNTFEFGMLSVLTIFATVLCSLTTIVLCCEFVVVNKTEDKSTAGLIKKKKKTV